MNIWQQISGKQVECLLCPHKCTLAEGKTGKCGARSNRDGTIVSDTYGVISALALDPVEKKPLYHFYPGKKILSVGSYGCNLKCDFCQNHNISQSAFKKMGANQILKPEKLIEKAREVSDNVGIAFTYNEPVIWFEYMKECAELAKSEGLSTVMISAGYVNEGPLEEIIGFIDAFNIDLKSFSDKTYRKISGAGIEPVKKSLKMISDAGKHLEITSLIIPDLNDNADEMRQETEWIANELGKNIPLHLSRYFPMFKRDNPPTPADVMMRLLEIASNWLNFVYLGNFASEKGQNTICPNCKKNLIVRSGYNVNFSNVDNKGCCSGCGEHIYGRFTI